MKFAKSYEPGEFEADIYGAWEASGVFAPQVTVDEKTGVASNKKGTQEAFSIVMPPPNANGNLHIGHGLTIALEDSLTRYYRLRGLASWYVPGADHAGFETWVVYERSLEAVGRTRFEFSRDELYAQVWDFVDKQRGNMELQLRALGASCNWLDLTFTLDENVVNRVYSTFEKMWKDGMIYRGEKLVNYCPKHQTAFADIEVEHQDEEGHLWDIAYPIVDPEDGDALKEIIVSTTRPETLPGDAAVAVNPEDTRYQGLVGKKVQLPLTNREIPIVADEHADIEYGTGAVKITPAHDYDDFEVGERHNLPRIVVIGPDGHMTAEAGEKYAGLDSGACREQILQDLEAAGLLRGEKKIQHSVAHCYKCGTVIEPTLKEQWFIDVKRLAAMAIEHLERGEIKFHPANKKKVLINYLKGLKDWNISRQIPWGIAIPMFRKVPSERSSASAGALLAHRTASTARSAAPVSLNNISEETLPNNTERSAASAGALLANDRGDEAPEWIFDRRTELNEIEVGGVKYVRDEDTFDTWFSSSHWPIVCTDWQEGVENAFYPLNVMETGADILFAWVARMIMMGVYVTGEVPFREVYLHGLVLDEHGQKMSKSKGNVINPMEMVAKYGSDAFRLGILRGRSAGMNQAFAENSVVSGRNLCNKLWNISRLVQNFVDEAQEEIFDGKTGVECDDEKGYCSGNMGEDWICREMDECRLKLEKCMTNYRFSEAVELIYSLIWDKYADWFVESQKLYRNVGLLKKTLEDLLIMAHPFMPFVTEVIWQNLSWTTGMIIAEKWPGKLVYDPMSAAEFERLQEVIVAARGTLRRLQTSGAITDTRKVEILFDNDSLVADNAEFVQTMTRTAAVIDCQGSPRGMRLALVNHEVYLGVAPEVVAKHKKSLEEHLTGVRKELAGLNARMDNPNYVAKAPAKLVEETRKAIAEKVELIQRLEGELKAI